MIEQLRGYKAWLSQRFNKKPATVLEGDDLGWNEKIPLALALIAQSYVIFNWYFKSVNGIHINVDFLVAIAAGVALDLIVVTTTMGRRQGRESRWSHATAFGAFMCSALIALNVYGAIPWIPEGWLHIAFPLEVWLYCQHLATPKRAPQRVGAMVAIQPAASPAPLSAPAPQPLPESDIPFSPAPVDDPVADPDPIADSSLPDWLIGGEEQPVAEEPEQEEQTGSGLSLRAQIYAILNKRGNLKDGELYALLPGKSQSSIRVNASDWRNGVPLKKPKAVPVNGNGKHA